jgi:hypothetical protein
MAGLIEEGEAKGLATAEPAIRVPADRAAQIVLFY